MNRNILVLDDDEHVLQLILKQLETSGLKATGFCSPEPVLEWFTEHGVPDLLISDVRMPRISGPELYKQLRKAYDDFPVIFVSGYHDAEQTHSLPVIKKPFTRAVLVEAIKAAL